MEELIFWVLLAFGAVAVVSMIFDDKGKDDEDF
jgi:hypothetical protein